MNKRSPQRYALIQSVMHWRPRQGVLGAVAATALLLGSATSGHAQFNSSPFNFQNSPYNFNNSPNNFQNNP